MKVGVLNGKYGRMSRFTQRFVAILEYNGIRPVVLDINERDFWEKVRCVTHFLYRWKHNDYDRQVAQTVLPVLEGEYGIKCYPNCRTCWSYDEKIRQYFLLKAHGLPVVESWVFWDRRKALQWTRTAAYPLVFKLKSGASSNSVILVKDAWTARRLTKRMFGKGIVPGRIPSMSATKWKDFSYWRLVKHEFGNVVRRLRGKDPESVWLPNKNYVLFQKFLPGNAYDTRVAVIGDRAYAFRRFTRKNDFRSSGSGDCDLDPGKIDLRQVQMALDVSREMGFQSMAYDFLYDEGGNPVFCEMSYTFPDERLHLCPGYWSSDLAWHEGCHWPQYFILLDLLGMPDLRQPPDDAQVWLT
jgi:hypothetical protein